MSLTFRRTVVFKSEKVDASFSYSSTSILYFLAKLRISFLNLLFFRQLLHVFSGDPADSLRDSLSAQCLLTHGHIRHYVMVRNGSDRGHHKFKKESYTVNMQCLSIFILISYVCELILQYYVLLGKSL